MKHWVLLALGLLAFAHFPSTVFAQPPCDPSTCPPGPVGVVFQYANCTGDLEYFSLGVQTEGCDTEENERVEIDATGIQYTYVYGGENCDISAANSSYYIERFEFGRCGSTGSFLRRDSSVYSSIATSHHSVAPVIPGMHPNLRHIFHTGKRDANALQGVMYLANVNDTFESPQPVFEFNPALITYLELSGYEPCAGIDNCTLPNGEEPLFYQNYHSEYRCSGTTSADMFPNVTLAKAACVNYFNITNIKLSCYGEHGFALQYFNTPDCTGPVFYSTAQQAVCGTKSTLTINCNVPVPQNTPENSNDPSSSSPSSSFQMTSLFLSTLLIATALLF